MMVEKKFPAIRQRLLVKRSTNDGGDRYSATRGESKRFLKNEVDEKEHDKDKDKDKEDKAKEDKDKEDKDEKDKDKEDNLKEKDEENKMVQDTQAPTVQPFLSPTNEPTPNPTRRPTPIPTSAPTVKSEPTQLPSVAPTPSPSAAPSTSDPSASPTPAPTSAPSMTVADVIAYIYMGVSVASGEDSNLLQDKIVVEFQSILCSIENLQLLDSQLIYNARDYCETGNSRFLKEESDTHITSGRTVLWRSPGVDVTPVRGSYSYDIWNVSFPVLVSSNVTVLQLAAQASVDARIETNEFWNVATSALVAIPGRESRVFERRCIPGHTCVTFRALRASGTFMLIADVLFAAMLLWLARRRKQNRVMKLLQQEKRKGGLVTPQGVEYMLGASPKNLNSTCATKDTFASKVSQEEDSDDEVDIGEDRPLHIPAEPPAPFSYKPDSRASLSESFLSRSRRLPSRKNSSGSDSSDGESASGFSLLKWMPSQYGPASVHSGSFA